MATELAHRTRTDAAVNGALIALGAVAVVDNVIAHWVLGLHRAVQGSWATPIEAGLVLVGLVMLATGLWRERRARRPQARGSPPHR